MIVDRITDLIGNTPLMRIDPSVHGLKNIDLYAKLEMMNPFGSLKDRIAWAMIKDDIEAIAAGSGTIYENSSGNTAKALQAIAGTYGVKVKLITNMAKVKEPKDVIRLLGTDIEEVVGSSECFDPTDPNDPQYVMERRARENGGMSFLPSQFTNPKNPAAHFESTGAEIAADLGKVDYLFGGLGTSGSTLGIGRALRQVNPELACIGICADPYDFVPGIRKLDQLWQSGLFEKENYSELTTVGSGEALDAMAELNRRCGILCGPTSGASYAGTMAYLRKIDETLTERKTAVFIVCDRVEWYTSYIRERRPQWFAEKKKPNSYRAFAERFDGKAPIVTIQDAPRWIAENEPLIVDTRANFSYKMLTIPGAINIPSEMLDVLMDGNRPFPPERPVLLICQIGANTPMQAAYLTHMGCQAYSLEMGLMGWRSSDYPLEMQEAA
jgi:cysteine synthase B